MRWLGFSLVSAATSLAASAALGATWCVDGAGGPATSCTEEVCENATALPTIADAISAAAGRPGEAAHVCVGGNDTHTETLAIDATNERFGPLLEITFGPFDGNYCPAQPGVPGLVVDAAGSPSLEVFVSFLFHDASACAVEAPLLEVAGEAVVRLNQVRVYGGEGPLVAAPGSPEVRIENSRFEGAVGPALVSGGDLYLQDVEVAAMTSIGAAVVEAAGELRIDTSALFGNVVTGAPAMQASGLMRATNLLVGANVVVDAPLLLVGGSPDQGTREFAGIVASTLSGNTLLSSGSATARPSAFRPVGNAGQGEFCIPDGSDGRWFHDRPRPSWSGSVGDGALVQLHPAASDEVFAITDSWVVENESNGPVVRTSSGAAPVSVFLEHTTFTHQQIVDGRSAAHRGRLAATRNLFMARPEYLLGSEWWGVEMTMEVVHGPDGPFVDGLDRIPAVLGPYLLVDQSLEPFRVLGDLEQQCDRLTALCPEASSDCRAGAVPGGRIHCALDAAVGYLPSTGLLAAATAAWPWETNWAEVGIDAMAGAGVGACVTRPSRLPFDRLGAGGDLQGDGDGYSDLIDCDNQDPLVRPTLPEPDGFGDGECVETDGDCYTCPESSGDDDDSEGGGVDDDDTSGDDDSWSRGPEREDCVSSGCGVSYGCGSSSPAPLAALLLVAVRRRSSRP